MELGLLHDFFGNFATRGERYYFGWRGAREVRICTWGENVYLRWARGDFEWWRGHARWEYVREVRMCMRGENVYMRWLWVVERGTQGENMYARGECVTRWEYARKVTLRGGGDNSTQGAQSHLVRWTIWSSQKINSYFWRFQANWWKCTKTKSLLEYIKLYSKNQKSSSVH